MHVHEVKQKMNVREILSDPKVINIQQTRYRARTALWRLSSSSIDTKPLSYAVHPSKSLFQGVILL